MKRKNGKFISLTIFVLCQIFITSPSLTTYTVEEILNKMKTVYSQVKDYTVRIKVEIDMEDIQVPPMNVTVFFKQPDKIHLKSDGFAMLPKEGLFLNPNRFDHDNFYFSLLGEDTLKTLTCYKIELVPKDEKIQVRKFFIWIDKDDWLILKAQTISWQGHITDISFEYQKVKNKYWLPKTAVMNINLSGFIGFNDIMHLQRQETSKDSSNTVKRGKIKVQFDNYKVNTGLSDSIFDDKIE